MTTNYENLKNKSVIITGGASGLGVGIAKILANQGAIISLIDIDYSNLKKTKNEIEKTANHISIYKCPNIHFTGNPIIGYSCGWWSF